MFFGFFAALQYSLQRAGIPSELMQALPYVAALVALAGFAGRVRAPAADGIPVRALKLERYGSRAAHTPCLSTGGTARGKNSVAATDAAVIRTSMSPSQEGVMTIAAQPIEIDIPVHEL